MVFLIFGIVQIHYYFLKILIKVLPYFLTSEKQNQMLPVMNSPFVRKQPVGSFT